MTIIQERCVVVVDAQELRRAGIAALLVPLAETLGVVTISLAPNELNRPLPNSAVPVFVVFSVGGTSLHSAQMSRWAADIARVFANVPCLVLSDLDEPEEAILAAQLGEQAFMSTSMEPHMALQIFAFVIGGGTYFPREALLQKAARPEATQPAGLTIDELSPRQLQVLEKLRQGVSNKQIARDLTLQESTVKVHVREIMRKLGAHNRTQAAIMGARVSSAVVQISASASKAPPMISGSLFGAAYRDRDKFARPESNTVVPLRTM